MNQPKIYGVSQNENVGIFIQTLLESKENNEIGIVKVIPDYKLKTKPLGVFHQIPSAHRQYVEKIGSNDANVFQMKYENVYPKNVHDLILLSKSIEIPKGSDTVEIGAWKDLIKRSQKKGRAPNKQPVYAINIRDSLFDEDEPWNFNNFGFEHSIIHGHRYELMNGIQNSYLNIGMLYTWFCLHCEDSNLASLNYLHSGEPKHWICVPKSEGPKLAKAIVDWLNSKYEYSCETVYRHKCFIVDESFLLKYGIKYTKLVQYPGEFVFTLYGAFHWGWNAGFNVCESMNLASPKFHQIYKNVSLCKPTCEYSQMPIRVHQKLGKLLQQANEPQMPNLPPSLQLYDTDFAINLNDFLINEPIPQNSTETSMCITKNAINGSFDNDYASTQRMEAVISNFAGARGLVKLETDHQWVANEGFIANDQTSTITEPRMIEMVQIQTLPPLPQLYDTDFAAHQSDMMIIDQIPQNATKTSMCLTTKASDGAFDNGYADTQQMEVAIDSFAGVDELVTPETDHQLVANEVLIAKGLMDSVAEPIITEAPSKKRKQKKAKSNGDEDNFCKMCNKSFTRTSTKKRHDNTYHGDYFIEYSCSFCNLKSLNPTNIITHHLIKHKEIEVPNEEEILWKKKKNSMKLQLARITKKKNSEQSTKTSTPTPQTCPICGITFKNGLKHLNPHLKKQHKTNNWKKMLCRKFTRTPPNEFN